MADIATPPVEDKKAKVVFEKPEKPDEDAFRTAEKKAQKEHDDAQAKYASIPQHFIQCDRRACMQLQQSELCAIANKLCRKLPGTRSTAPSPAKTRTHPKGSVALNLSMS